MTLRRPLPADRYVLPEHYRAECEAIFGREWLVVAALAAIPDGHATATTVASLPIVVRRQGDAVTAFLNICPHRAGPLVWADETERCVRFQCKYHGWQFAPDGALHRAPDFGADAPDARLTPLHVKIWRGLVFVCAATEPPDLAPRLTALSEAIDWSGWTVRKRARHPLACNWKTYVENYLEGYHIPYMHPGLSAEISLRTYRVESESGVVRHHVRPAEDASNAGFWAWVWPNTAINVYDGGLSLERIIPVGPAETRIEYTYLFDPSVPDADANRAIGLSTTVTGEDIAICEAVQSNLESGRYAPGWLSPKHEGGVAHFHDAIRAALPI